MPPVGSTGRIQPKMFALLEDGQGGCVVNLGARGDGDGPGRLYISKRPMADGTAHGTARGGTTRRPVHGPPAWSMTRHGHDTVRERHSGRHGRQTGITAAPTTLLVVARWPSPHHTAHPPHIKSWRPPQP
jgi:hypothetical protein